MRYVSDIPPIATSPNTRQVTGLSATHAVKPIQPHNELVTYVEQRAEHQRPVIVVEQSLPAKDRRIYCRRVSHQSVLVELRSGTERRRHNLFNSGSDEHIDVEA